MKQILLEKGNVVVNEIPAPRVEANTALVSVGYSCISSGTELSGLKMSGASLLKRALSKAEKIKKPFQLAKTQGLLTSLSVVQDKRATMSPTGYSDSGIVQAIGTGIDDIKVGDRVACAGAQCAYHAEIIRVPRNLMALIPDPLDLKLASTVTLGAIALQGVRRTQPTLGETFIVIGLGILVQLVSQLLKVNGCRVIGTDLNQNRIDLAKELGMEIGLHPDDDNNIEQVVRLTDGVGADGVLIT